MKHTLLVAATCLCIHLSFGQNRVGIGTPTPSELLDVNGNVNLAGQLKVNGNAGTANQVLAKNGSNLPTWMDISGYKTIEVYDNQTVALSNGTGNSSVSWTVPAGVTEVFFECWGGGGGGGFSSGGGGGAYAAAKLVVVPGTSVMLQIGAGGRYSIGTASGISGGSTVVAYTSYTVTANGGTGGSASNPAISNFVTYPAFGGAATGNVAPFLFTEIGKPSGVSRVTFTQIAATDFAKVIYYGDGGDAGQSPGSGAKGGYSLIGASFSTYIGAPLAIIAGGGGGADYSQGFSGRGGRIILHY